MVLSRDLLLKIEDQTVLSSRLLARFIEFMLKEESQTDIVEMLTLEAREARLAAARDRRDAETS